MINSNGWMICEFAVWLILVKFSCLFCCFVCWFWVFALKLLMLYDAGFWIQGHRCTRMLMLSRFVPCGFLCDLVLRLLLKNMFVCVVIGEWGVCNANVWRGIMGFIDTVGGKKYYWLFSFLLSQILSSEIRESKTELKLVSHIIEPNPKGSCILSSKIKKINCNLRSHPRLP